WGTNRVGFCTAAALATAEAVLRTIGAAACIAAPLAALANCPESSRVTCSPHAASQVDAARVRPIRNAFRWGEGNRLLIMSAGEQEGRQRPPEASARRQVSPAGRGRNSAAIAFVDPLAWDSWVSQPNCKLNRWNTPVFRCHLLTALTDRGLQCANLRVDGALVWRSDPSSAAIEG